MSLELGERVPKSAKSSTIPLQPIDRRIRPKFVLAVHPRRCVWDPVEKDWLPELGRMVVDPGVQGVSYDGRVLDDSEARTWYTRNGWILIESGDERLKKILPDGEYLARHRARGGSGWAYTFVWEGFERIEGDKVEWRENRKVRVKFQRFLLASNIVPPMPEIQKRKALRQARDRVRRLGEKVAQNPNFPTVSYRLREAEQRLQEMLKAAGLGTVEDLLELGDTGPEPDPEDENLDIDGIEGLGMPTEAPKAKSPKVK